MPQKHTLEQLESELEDVQRLMIDALWRESMTVQFPDPNQYFDESPAEFISKGFAKNPRNPELYLHLAKIFAALEEMAVRLPPFPERALEHTNFRDGIWKHATIFQGIMQKLAKTQCDLFPQWDDTTPPQRIYAQQLPKWIVPWIHQCAGAARILLDASGGKAKGEINQLLKVLMDYSSATQLPVSKHNEAVPLISQARKPVIAKKDKMGSIDLIIGHIDSHESYKSGPTSGSTTIFRRFPYTLTDPRLLREPTFGEEEIVCPFCNSKIKLRFLSNVYYELTANEKNRDILQSINLRAYMFWTVFGTATFFGLFALLVGMCGSPMSLCAVVFLSPIILGCIIVLLSGRANIAKGVSLNKRYLISWKYGNGFKERMDAGPKNNIILVEVDSKHGIVVARNKSGVGIGVDGGVITYYENSAEGLTNEYRPENKSCKEYNAYDDFFYTE